MAVLAAAVASVFFSQRNTWPSENPVLAHNRTACPLTEITDPSTEPANAHIPDCPFPLPDPDSFDFVGVNGNGVFVSRVDILLALKAEAAVGESNELLTILSNALAGTVNIVGGLPQVGWFLIRVPDPGPGSLQTTLDVVSALNRSTLSGFGRPEVPNPVELAVFDMTAVPNTLPPINTSGTTIPPGNLVPNLWTYEAQSPPVNGNWGLKMVRAPEMWNMNTFVERFDQSNPGANDVCAGVVDDGFTDAVPANTSAVSTHRDLPNLTIRAPAGRAANIRDHGTMVAGIIGAAWDNRTGVEGLNPWLTRIVGTENATFANHQSWATQGGLIFGLLRSDPCVKAVNNSYGYTYADFSIANPATRGYGDINGDGDHTDPGEFRVDLNNDGAPDTWRQLMDHYGSIFARGARIFAEGLSIGPVVVIPPTRDDFFVVASAGNDGNTFGARDTSPTANADVQQNERHFLAVEAIDTDGDAAALSTLGGRVAAPGVCVRGTEAQDGNNFDDLVNNATGNPPADNMADCGATANWPAMNQWWDGGGNAAVAKDQAYATGSGTSFAAPYVTALITGLWKLDPNLSVAQIRNILDNTGVNVPTSFAAFDRIDAFAAAMQIDVVRNNKVLQKALVDVDDGSHDGNLRVVPETGIAFLVVSTADGRRGDGRIDMGDFRAVRDAFLQACVEDGADLDADCPDPATVDRGGDNSALNGAKNHRKKDLNLDGCANGQTYSGGAPACGANSPLENIFPRYDFNGDGRANDRPAPANDPAQRVRGKTDLGVLADTDLWQSLRFDAQILSFPPPPGRELGLIVVSDEVQAGANDGGDADNNEGNDPIHPRTGLTREIIIPGGFDVDGPDYLRSVDLHLVVHFGPNTNRFALTIDSTFDVFLTQATETGFRKCIHYGTGAGECGLAGIFAARTADGPPVPNNKTVEFLITVPVYAESVPNIFLQGSGFTATGVQTFDISEQIVGPKPGQDIFRSFADRQIDDDGDGTPNDRDDCPGQPGPPENNGCPIPVGGIGFFPAGGGSSGPSAGVLVGIGAGIAASAVTLGGAAWWATRRRLARG